MSKYGKVAEALGKVPEPFTTKRMAEEVGLSPAGVWKQLSRLEEKGIVQKLGDYRWVSGSREPDLVLELRILRARIKAVAKTLDRLDKEFGSLIRRVEE